MPSIRRGICIYCVRAAPQPRGGNENEDPCGEEGGEPFLHCAAVRRVRPPAAEAERSAGGRDAGDGADAGDPAAGEDPHRAVGGHGVFHSKEIRRVRQRNFSKQHFFTGAGNADARGGADCDPEGRAQGRGAGGERLRLSLHRKRPAAAGAALHDLCDAVYLRHRGERAADAPAGRGHSGGSGAVRRAAVDAPGVLDGGGAVLLGAGGGAFAERTAAGGTAGAGEGDFEGKGLRRAGRGL